MYLSSVFRFCLESVVVYAVQNMLSLLMWVSSSATAEGTHGRGQGQEQGQGYREGRCHGRRRLNWGWAAFFAVALFSVKGEETDSGRRNVLQTKHSSILMAPCICFETIALGILHHRPWTVSQHGKLAISWLRTTTSGRLTPWRRRCIGTSFKTTGTEMSTSCRVLRIEFRSKTRSWYECMSP